MEKLHSWILLEKMVSNTNEQSNLSGIKKLIKNKDLQLRLHDVTNGLVDYQKLHLI